MTGDEFRLLRETIPMTAAELAEWLGVSRMTVWRWEAERASIPGEIVRAVSDAATEPTEREIAVADRMSGDGEGAGDAQWVDRGGGWLVAEPPSDRAMVERIRALGFAVPFTLTGEAQQADRLTREVVERYTILYGSPADEEQVRRACGLPSRAGDAAEGEGEA